MTLKSIIARSHTGVTAASDRAIKIKLEAKGYIQHNYLHHNQRSGLGYDSHLGASKALIEANRFDWDRYCVDGLGAPGMSYDASFLNLVMPHATSSHFGPHAFANPNGPHGSGERLDIHHNTFYKSVPYETAIVIKGLSSKGVSIHHNWSVTYPTFAKLVHRIYIRAKLPGIFMPTKTSSGRTGQARFARATRFQDLDRGVLLHLH